MSTGKETVGVYLRLDKDLVAELRQKASERGLGLCEYLRAIIGREGIRSHHPKAPSVPGASVEEVGDGS
jgi:hypothetical protein